MLNSKLLEKEIEDSGLRQKKIAEWLNISYWGFRLKVRGKHDFKIGEVEKLCEILRITEPDRVNAIFFANSVVCKTTKENR